MKNTGLEELNYFVTKYYALTTTRPHFQSPAVLYRLMW